METFCSYCDSKIFESDRVCNQCGAPIKNVVGRELETVEYSSHRNLTWEDYASTQILGLAVAGGDFTIKCGETKKIQIYAVTEKDAPFIIPYNTLGFNIKKDNFEGIIDMWNANDGIMFKSRSKILKSSKGKVNINVNLLAKPSVETSFAVEIK
jgi:hypothetical protein